MENGIKDLGDVVMIGIHENDLSELQDIAKKQNKSVVEVASEAIRKHIDGSKGLQESKQRKILTEDR